MSKADLHVKMDLALTEAIRRYAEVNGLNFTAALSSLAARGLRAEGVTISVPEGDRAG